MNHHPNETPEPLAQEQAAEMAIRKALAEFPKGWETVFQQVREREPGVVEIGAFWEDSDDLAEVITIDTGNYYDNASAMPIARFIAACNPSAVAAILAALQAKDAEIARLKADAGRYAWCIANTYESKTLMANAHYRPMSKSEVDQAIAAAIRAQTGGAQT